MKLSFREIIDSEAYQAQAQAVSKANIFVATAVAVFVMIFRNWGFGLWWFIIIPVLWFAASLLIAMPFMAFKVAVAAALSENPRSAWRYTSLIDLLNYVVLIPLTYYALWQLHRSVFAE